MADLNKIVQDLMEKVSNLTKDFEAEKVNNQELEAKLTKLDNALPNLASTIEEIARKNAIADAKGWTMPKLEEVDGFKEHTLKRSQDAGTPIEKLPFTGKKGGCPYCTEHGRESLLDLTKSGRWACRTCGKHWYAEALGQKYSKELEKFIRGDEGAVDPIIAFRKEKDEEEKADEMTELKKQVKDLNDLLLKTLVNKNV